jgi:hypothetical protein
MLEAGFINLYGTTRAYRSGRPDKTGSGWHFSVLSGLILPFGFERPWGTRNVYLILVVEEYFFGVLLCPLTSKNPPVFLESLTICSTRWIVMFLVVSHINMYILNTIARKYSSYCLLVVDRVRTDFLDL